MTTNSKRKSAIVELKALLEEDGDRLRTLFQELLQELLEQEMTRARNPARELRQGRTRSREMNASPGPGAVPPMPGDAGRQDSGSPIPSAAAHQSKPGSPQARNQGLRMSGLL